MTTDRVSEGWEIFGVVGDDEIVAPRRTLGHRSVDNVGCARLRRESACGTSSSIIEDLDIATA